MNDNNVKITVSSTAKTDGITKTQEELERLGQKADVSSQGTSRLNSAFDNFKGALVAVGGAFAAYQLVQKIEDFGSMAVKSAGELEQTNISFQNLIGNTKDANDLFSGLVQYANTTPFQSKEITDAAKTLLAFGEDAKGTTGVIKQLGDVVSAGGGNLQQLSLVTGQIFAQGKMRAQDMYQVINDGGAGLIKIMAQDAGGMQNLTQMFEKGGVPSKLYFDAITKATANGGFAFQGAQKQAETFNGKVSTLKDTVTQFGMSLLGVRIDPQLGLVIQPGGLFDKMKKGIDAINSALQGWGPAASRVIPEVMDKIGALFEKLDKFLGPSFHALYNTLTEKVIPVLSRLWHEVIEPMLPVVGGAFVGAIKLSVDILNALLRAITPVINFMLDNKPVVEGLTGAFVALGVAMKLDAMFNALTVGFETFRLITIPQTIASVEAFKKVATSPTIMGGLVVAGILADIGLVYDALQKVRGAIQDVNNAAKAADNLGSDSQIRDLQQKAAAARARGDTAAVQRYANAIAANGGGRATGGAVSAGKAYLVGENPDGTPNSTSEIFIPNQSGTIIPARQTRQLLNGNQGASPTMHNTFNIYNQIDYEAGIRELGWRLRNA